MIRHKDDCMGRFSVEVELTNNDDMALVRRGSLAPDQVRRIRVKGVVDSGASSLVIPREVVRALDLPLTDKARIRYVDGRSALRDVADSIRLDFGTRHGLFTAVVEPKRRDALIGAIVLEALDLIVDCKHMTLTPRDPKHIISELE